jgi:DnaJ-class molecular chaperone
MVSVVEAILGGRIEVPTAKGTVRLSVPPGSSGGTRLRLKGRGAEGGDLYVVLRIEVPRRIDEQSRALIERFAELNPAHPHDDS